MDVEGSVVEPAIATLLCPTSSLQHSEQADRMCKARLQDGGTRNTARHGKQQRKRRTVTG